MNIPKNKTWVMPAGDNREELIKIYPKVIEMCAEHGYNFTGREHIIAYDTKRGV
jgi:7-carboxy-7-deazaguanine synthase